MSAVAHQRLLSLHDDMDVMQDVGQNEIDFDIDYGTGALRYDDGDEMSDDPPSVREIEYIGMRSVTEGDEQMLDDVAATEAADEVISEITVEDMPLVDHIADGKAFAYDTDEDLLDLSEDDDTSTPVVQPNETVDDETTMDLSATASGVHVQFSSVAATDDASAPEGVQKDDHLAPAETVSSILHEKVEHSLADTADDDLSGPAATSSIAEPQHTKSADAHYSTESTEDQVQRGPEDENNDTLDEIDDELQEPEVPETEDDPAAKIPQSIQEQETTDEQQTIAQEQALETVNASTDEQTYTGLHTTIVKIAGSDYFLFPPNASQEHTHEGVDFLLDDENLAISSIADMLHACRIVMGSSVAEDEELEMHIDDLGLILGQDAPAAFSTSFSEILDIYVNLYRNDGFEHIPVMVVSFNTRLRFAHRLTSLVNHVAEGKGLQGLRPQQDVFVHNEANGADEHPQQEPELVVEEALDSSVNVDANANANTNDKDGGTFRVPDDESDVATEEVAGEEEPTVLATKDLAELEAEQAATEHDSDDVSSHTLSVDDTIVAADEREDEHDESASGQSSKSPKQELNDELFAPAPATEGHGQDGLAAAVNEKQPLSPFRTEEEVGVSLTVVSDTKERPDDFEGSDDFDEIDFDDDIESAALPETSDSTASQTGQKRGLAADAELDVQTPKRPRPS